jgi:hypothetical protein
VYRDASVKIFQGLHIILAFVVKILPSVATIISVVATFFVDKYSFDYKIVIAESTKAFKQTGLGLPGYECCPNIGGHINPIVA